MNERKAEVLLTVVHRAMCTPRRVTEAVGIPGQGAVPVRSRRRALTILFSQGQESRAE
jgi:hypothetical protein